MKIERKTDTKESKEFWDGVQRASDFIDTLPEWQQRVWGFSKD